ncbi:MAG: PQQ-binding-like beta-propeller repeat protein [Verrucomicrobiales bacterium]|nr:PQQ-binding-like beta-propeller repeat protein [Verrucomicrobiales bacterium]
MKPISPFSLSCILFSLSAFGQENWSHWLGDNRNGISAESSGFEPGKPWPPGPPIWTVNVGEGASSPILVDGVVYAFGWENGENVTRALEAKTGKVIWQESFPGPRFGRQARGDQRMYAGATSTPEFDAESGFLFTLSADGDLVARNTKADGDLVWHQNFYTLFDVPRRPQITKRKNTLRDYGYTTSPFVFEDWVIAEVGDRKGGCVKAFDKKTGKLAWSSENRDPAGHTGGLTPMTIEGVPCLAVATSYHALVLRLDGSNAGKTVAEFPWATDFSNTIAGIAAQGNELLIASRYNQMAMAKVAISLRGGAKQVWRNQYPTGVCTPVIHDGRIYFANKGIHCVDFKTGKLIWEGGRIGDAGSCFVAADDRLVVWGNDGDLSLVETAGRSPKKCTVLAEKRGVFNSMAWPHVVLADGRIFCKTVNGDLACFSLKGEAPAAGTPSSPDTPAAPTEWKLSNWPGENPAGLIWSWKQGDGLAKRSVAARRAKMEARGSAKFDANGAMKLDGGGFLLKGVSGALMDRMQKSNAFTIELIFQTDDLRQKGPARVVSFSKDPYERNFTIGQEGDRLSLRLRTSTNDKNGMKPELKLMKFEQGRINSVCLTFEQGSFVGYLNGKPVTRSRAVTGDFSNWDELHGLILGDEFSGGSRDWKGTIHALAFFDRALPESEVAARIQLAAE